MKLIHTICLTFLAVQTAFPQKTVVNEIKAIVTEAGAQAQLMFLSADEMRGRDTGSPELEIAARYIASEFHQYGLKQISGADKYFQTVGLESFRPATGGTLVFGPDACVFKENFLIESGSSMSFTGEFVFIGYGSADEIPSSLAGKVAVAIAGTREGEGDLGLFAAGVEKLDRVKAAGAVALIEYLSTSPYPWPVLVNRLSGTPRMNVWKESPIPHLLMKDIDSPGFKELKEKKLVKGSLSVQKEPGAKVMVRNVVGMVEGTDPQLRNEYMVISAHYDHVGIGLKRGQDSIYNGARDNAIGTVAMLSSAKYFSKHPARRSIIFIAFTAEEKGLLGSQWYRDHPLKPLKETVFDLNCDGAGYNNTKLATMIGLDRTSVGKHLRMGCAGLDLDVNDDPIPQMNLYEHSDNFNFAMAGVPSVNFSPGLNDFDEEIRRYLHQPADEYASLDFSYLVRFFRAFVNTAGMIANDTQRPQWAAGDRFEMTGKKLYGNK